MKTTNSWKAWAVVLRHGDLAIVRSKWPETWVHPLFYRRKDVQGLADVGPGARVTVLMLLASNRIEDLLTGRKGRP